MWFSTWCNKREADGLFNEDFVRLWIWTDYPNENMDDTFSMYCMGGEL